MSISIMTQKWQVLLKDYKECKQAFVEVERCSITFFRK